MTIKIDFEFETEYGKFADALHLPDDHNLSDEEIDAMKLQRRDNWISIVTAPPEPEPEPEPEYIEVDGIRYMKV